MSPWMWRQSIWASLAGQLSWLIAEGRAPYASIGGNIGKKQRYVRVYTEPLIDLLCGSDHIDQDDIDQ